MKILKTKKIVFWSLLAAVLFFAVSVGVASAFTQLTSQMGIGATGANVTNLQDFLASNSSIYPERLVTGYFGPLTRSAVTRFQTAFGISPVGRVGPITMAKINSLIATGANLTGIGGGTTGDVFAPIISPVSVSVSRTGAVVNWTTNEQATQKVYYHTFPFQLAEAQVGVAMPTIIGGQTTPQSTSLQTGQSVSIQNLTPNTLYYYMVESIDSSGNFSYTWPATFTTTN